MRVRYRLEGRVLGDDGQVVFDAQGDPFGQLAQGPCQNQETVRPTEGERRDSNHDRLDHN